MDRFPFNRCMVGFDEALHLALENVPMLPEEWSSTVEALGRVAARDIIALVDAPSVDSSIKDGYAVISEDVATATPCRPVELKLVDSVWAGDEVERAVAHGTAARILSGVIIPAEADAVLAEEFTELDAGIVRVFADVYQGRNILRKGADVSVGELLVPPGAVLTPAKIGYPHGRGRFSTDCFSSASRRPSGYGRRGFTSWTTNQTRKTLCQ